MSSSSAILLTVNL